MICYNCGKTFHGNETVRKYDPETGATYCCPCCGDDNIGDSEECAVCGKDFAEGETSNGFCLSCLWEAIDYDVALAYMLDNDNGLLKFLLGDWFGASFGEIVSTDALDKFMQETYRRLVADEKIRTAVSKSEEPRFLEACRLFCLPHYYNGDFGIEGHEFAEWYAEQTKTAMR